MRNIVDFLKILAFVVTLGIAVAAPAAAVTDVGCIGDDLTVNRGVTLPFPQPYTAVLQSALGTRFLVTNYGVAGATMLNEGGQGYLSSAEFLNVERRRPDIVVILLGTNDSKPPLWPYEANLGSAVADLVHHCETFSNHPKVFCCLPPPAGPNTLQIYEDHLAGGIVPAIRDAAVRLGVPVVDTRAALAPFPNTTTKGVYPNEDGCRRLAGAIYRSLITSGVTTAPPRPPQIVSFTAPEASTTKAKMVFTAVFDRPMLDLDASRLQLVNAGGAVTSCKDIGLTWSVGVTALAETQISVTIPPGAATGLDLSTNDAPATASQTYTGNPITTPPTCGTGALGLFLVVGFLLHARRRAGAQRSAAA